MSDNTQDFRPMQARYLELEAEVEKAKEACGVWRDNFAKALKRAERAEAELAKVKAQWEFAAKAQVERSEKAEAEVERLRVRLRTVVTEWQLRCAALANGEKP